VPAPHSRPQHRQFSLSELKMVPELEISGVASIDFLLGVPATASTSVNLID
jgi:hypothetical protein